MKKLLVLTSIATMAVSSAFADLPTGIELGIGLSGSTGLNGFVGYANKKSESSWLKRLGVRLDLASTSLIKKPINSAIDKYMGDGIKVGDYLNVTDGNIDSEHMALLFDIYPFGDTWFLGGWRVSAGYMIGGATVNTMLTGNDDRLSGLAGQEFEIWGTRYKYEGNDVHGTARAKWDFTGPYAGTGFDIGLFRGFKLFVDAGVVFTSHSAELSMDVPVKDAGLKYLDTSGATPEWKDVNTAFLENTLKSNIDKTIADAQKKMDEWRLFPIVKLGFMYRF